MKDNIEFLRETITTISLLGKTRGQEIGVEDIAFNAQISGEQLHAYLNGEQNIPEGFIAKLRTLYGFRTTIVTWLDYVSFGDEDVEDDGDEEDDEG